ncbi:MAG: glutathione S-transferase N-terminal domain-containing protein [Pseudomonadota bacterium]
MNAIVSYSFKLAHMLVGPLLLLGDRLTAPRRVQRDPTAQARIDAETRELVLYQFRSCPFCIKTRRAIRRLALNIETRDAQHHQPSRQQLLKCGGKLMVPCLRIAKPDGSMQWMYESNDIIRYLESRFTGE